VEAEEADLEVEGGSDSAALCDFDDDAPVGKGIEGRRPSAA
jgi:hypothetical protein